MPIFCPAIDVKGFLKLPNLQNECQLFVLPLIKRVFEASKLAEWMPIFCAATDVKGFLKLPNLHMLIKRKIPLLPRNLALGTFGELLMVFPTKVNLLYLRYSTAQRCCLLHLVKQNCFLKTFLRTLILMTQVSLYLFSLLELIWNCIIFM